MVGRLVNKGAAMEDKEVIALLASGAVLLEDEDRMGAELVTRHAQISSEQWNRLGRQGWLKPFANNGGAWLSDAGRLAYIRSTDELGNGVMVPPNA